MGFSKEQVGSLRKICDSDAFIDAVSAVAREYADDRAYQEKKRPRGDIKPDLGRLERAAKVMARLLRSNDELVQTLGFPLPVFSDLAPRLLVLADLARVRAELLPRVPTREKSEAEPFACYKLWYIFERFNVKYVGMPAGSAVECFRILFESVRQKELSEEAALRYVKLVIKIQRRSRLR